MKPLLPTSSPTSSPTYLRRLVRELNQAGMVDCFVAPVQAGGGSCRCDRARLKNGTLEVHGLGGKWIRPYSLSFSDPYGRPIIASRIAP